MLLLSLLPDCVFMHGIQSLLSMKELLVLACASKRMSNCTASAIKEKVDRDARFLPFAEALMERVKVHTGLSIPFSIDRFRRIRKAIVYHGYSVPSRYRTIPTSVVTIFDGKLTVERGLSCLISLDYRLPKVYASCSLTIDIIEAGEVKTFKGEARHNHECYKFPDGTSFEAMLESFQPMAAYFMGARNAARNEASALEQMRQAEIAEKLAQCKKILESMDDLDEGLAGGTETRDDDCILLGDDDCFIVEDARTKTRDDDCILLGDDDCHIVEDA